MSTANSSFPVEAMPRITGQCQAVLQRLQQGRATNVELSKISLKYTSRISDLRKIGFDIACVSHDHKTGLASYELQGGLA